MESYEAATSGKGEQTHALSRAAAQRVRIYGMPHTASSLCGHNVTPIGSALRTRHPVETGVCMKPQPVPDFPPCSECGKTTRRHGIIRGKRVPLCGDCAKN